MIHRLLCTLLSVLLASFPMVSVAGQADAGNLDSPQSHEEQIADWRQRRHDRLNSDNGWVTLVGLEWLQEGENRVGNDSSSAINIPGGPADWGTIHLDGDELRFVPVQDGGIIVNGAEVAEFMLVADNQGEPTIVRSGNLSFYVIFRESYAVRIKDTQAPSFLAFNGVSNYGFQADWRIDARFIPAEKGQTIPIGNVLGQLSASPVYGYVEFERAGVKYRLLGLGDENSESLWFLFADRTSGRETYGAGRFLYSDGMPKDGRLLVDFNKAYNPPCAFNDYSTCPLPPQQNRLDLAVMAGEKDYHAK
jgi:uncharacterized protein (DUF1684 family)